MIELVHDPIYRTVIFGGLLVVALLVGTLVWYFKVGKPRMASYSETQKAHVAFRQRLNGFFIMGIILLPMLTMRLPTIPLRGGEELPVQLLVCLGFPVLFQIALSVAGRIKFGEEGRLKPKKDKTIHK